MATATAKRSTKDKPKIEALTTHGVEFNRIPDKGVAEGICPFCGDEPFHCNVITGRYQCKKCHAEGNHYTFLQELYARCLKDTKKADYEMLSEQRDGLNYLAWKNWNYAYHRDMHRWLIPCYNTEKKLANLLHWDAHRESPGPYSTAACSTHMLGIERLKQVGPIHICEGAWDGPALDFLFLKTGVDTATNSVLAVPSASFSLEKLKDTFKGRELILYYDNDPAGIDGQTKQLQAVQKTAKAAAGIHWPSEFPVGYDLRDFITERISNPKKCLNEVKGLFDYTKEVEKKNLPKVPDFPALVKQFRKVLHLEQNQLDALAICVAVVASQGSRGTPLWVFLVGPPGCGKSEMLMAFSQLTEKCLFVSRLTVESLISGAPGEGDDDPSIMAYLKNRCLVIKDFTAVKAMNQEKQVDLFGMLRDAYDGEISKPFGNGIKIRKYDGCWFPILTGVTHVIHADNQSAHGERFLKFELLGEDHDVNKQTTASMEKAESDAKAKIPDETLKNAIIAFFDQRKLDRDKLVPISDTKYGPKIMALAHIVSIVRTSVEKKGQALSFRPTAENPGRVGAQLTKMSKYLCWVFDKKKMDDEVYSIIRKHAHDTVISWALDVCKLLVKHPKGLSMFDITRQLQAATDTLKPHIDLLCQIIYPYGRNEHDHVIHIVDQPLEGSTKTKRVYVANPKFVQFWKDAELISKSTIVSLPKRQRTRGPQPGTKYNPRKVKRGKTKIIRKTTGSSA